MMASCKPGLGQALIIGRGGTAVEELRDFVTLLLTASLSQIKKALESLEITRALRLTESDFVALIQAIENMSRFAYGKREQLEELDVNPLILDTCGKVIAVDALLRIAK